MKEPDNLKGKPTHALDIYPPQQGHERSIRAIHVPTPHGAPRDDVESTVLGGQYALRGEFEQLMQRSGSQVEHEVIDVDTVLQKEKLPHRTTPEQGVRNAPQIIAIGKETAQHVKIAVDAGYVPIIAGGDHATLIMGLPELLDRYPDAENPGYSSLRLVFTDAHPDALQEPETVGNAHGRTISTLLGIGPKDLLPLMQGRLKLQPKNLFFVGTSKPDDPEIRLIETLENAAGLQCWDIMKMRSDPKGFEQALKEFLTIREADGTVRAAPVWAELDPDVLQKTDSQGTPMTSSVGMSAEELIRLALLLASEGKVVGAGTAEIAPNLDTGGKTKDLVNAYFYRLLGKGDEYYHEYDPHKITNATQPNRVDQKNGLWNNVRKSAYAFATAASVAAAAIGGYLTGKTNNEHTEPNPLTAKMEKEYLQQARLKILQRFDQSAFQETAKALRLAVNSGNQKGIQSAIASMARMYQFIEHDAPDAASVSDLGYVAWSKFVEGFGHSPNGYQYYQKVLAVKNEAENRKI